MERVKEQRSFCSLSKSQRDQERDCERDRDRERRYTASSADQEEGACRVPTQKSYSSSETLQAFDHDPSRMLFGGRVKELVRKESVEYSRAGQTFSLRQLGFCEPSARRGLALCPETGLSHPLSSYSRGPVTTENHEPVSPERTMALWGTGAKSGQNSCLSSRSNSALTLTDTEMDNKSDNEMGDHLASQQGPPPLPPAPPPHKQHPSITSLSRGSLANQRSPSPPPAAGLAAELQSTAECVQLQDSWVLGSNVALESRHFLFKTGTGTTPFFGAASPGYTMATGTVYSTPARPLPRNTLSRGAFKFKKSPKHCSWKCTALIAVGVAVVLSIILCYCIAMHLFGLNWQLQELDNQPTFENGGIGKTGPTLSSIVTALSADTGRTSVLHQENNSIDTGQVEIGKKVGQSVPPGVFWRSQLNLEQPRFLKFNISVQKNALIGVYGRKGLAPSHTQYDFVELLDGSRLIAKEHRTPNEPELRLRLEHPVSVHQAGFIQYLDSGVWHVAFYNDGRTLEAVSYNTIIQESVTECTHNCYGNGECVAGSCHCFPGFIGPYCSRAACPILCSGNGQYARGRCQCYSGWKSTECDVPASQCIDPQCGGHGLCVAGNCVCNTGHKGSNCEQVDCLNPTCSGHGTCHHGECHCNPGWGGLSCEILKSTCPEQCSSHGTFSTNSGTCICDANWTGADCSIEVCVVDCGPHGSCLSGVCHCEEGWTGPECEQRDCHPRCIDHGICREGKCDCHQGWTGEHCTIGEP